MALGRAMGMIFQRVRDAGQSLLSYLADKDGNRLKSLNGNYFISNPRP